MNNEKQPDREKANVVYIYEGKPVKISKSTLSLLRKIKPKAKVELEINDHS